MFQLSTHHGDPDLIVSRNEKFPSKDKTEKLSSRAGRFSDIITFSRDEDGTIFGKTFYVTVTGMSYSTFNLLVTTQKENTTSNAPILISEGVPQ